VSVHFMDKLYFKLMIKRVLPAVFLVLMAVGHSYAALPLEAQHKVLGSFHEIAFVLLLGVLVGVVGTLIGAGGGFLVVPTLIILYGFTPQHAVGTSMVVVFLNALSGTFSYVAQKRIDYGLGIRFAVFASPGVIIGAFAGQQLSSMIFSILFSLLLTLMAYSLIFKKDFYLVCEAGVLPAQRTVHDAGGEVHTYSPDLSIGYSGSFLVGLLSGLFGIGGGLIHVPLMNFMGIPIHIAAATSHFMIVITSFFGVMIFLGLKTIDLHYAVFLGVGSILGAYFGAKIAAETDSDLIKKIIAVILVLVALRLLLGT